MSQDRLLVSPKDAQRILGIGHTKIYELLKAGALTRVKLGAATRISVASIHALASKGAPK
jgi:excisionase family DNA binding protein